MAHSESLSFFCPTCSAPVTADGGDAPNACPECGSGLDLVRAGVEAARRVQAGLRQALKGLETVC